MRSEVSKIESADSWVHAEWQITVTRDYCSGSPPVDDLPADVRAALYEWLGVPAPTKESQ